MATLPQGYTIRAGEIRDIEALQALDVRASHLFEPTGLIEFPEAGPEPIPESELLNGISTGWLFVVIWEPEKPVGFAYCTQKRSHLYLDQISVDPFHGRRGLGSALIETVVSGAEREGLNSVILSTFRDVPWNGPFYSSLGFTEIPRRRYVSWMQKLEAIQAETMDVTLRCFMQRKLPDKREGRPRLLPMFAGRKMK